MSEPEQRAVEGLAHLQGAAVQLIAATRAFLDVAEGLVTDPAAAGALVHTLGALAGVARGEWDRATGGAAAPRPEEGATGTGPVRGDGDGRIVRIPIADEA